ncbi:MAG: hypothetical protein WCJ41_19530 [Aestuariivirga sp.]|uniref:hypothetical protein n=1 Tax=Aestuariivirga sp. TaxID=2650926 RepID=UPI003018E94B
MNFKTLSRVAVMAAGLALAATVAGAAEPANQHVPLQKTIGKPMNQGPVPSLGVINSDGATLEGNKLTLTGVSGNVIIFADRPVRAAGHETTDLFISRWGDGKDSFKSDPPNATVSVLGGDKDGVTDAVVVLKSPKLDGTTLVFDVDVLEGDLKGLKGPAAVFIDWFAAGGGHGGWAAGGGGWHGGHAWYGAPVAAGVAAGAVAGAAIGAAAAAPYYAAPACGYYPYPPCY